MQTSQSVYLALALLPLIFASQVHGDSSEQCKEGVCPVGKAKREKAHSLIQSGSSVVPTVMIPFAEDDLDEDLLPKRTGLASVSKDDPAFYFAVCLDFLIVAIVANGVQRYRNGDHLAVRQSRQTQSKVVKKKEQFDVGGIPLLHAAVREGDQAQCEALLSKCSAASVKRLLAGQDFWGCSALHLACDAGNAQVAALLLDRGANTVAVDTWDQTPMHFAARSGSAEICKLLISRGAAIDAPDSDERTPLHIAGLAGHEAACEVLLDHGAALSSVDDTDVPPILSLLLVQRMFQQLPSAK